MTFTVEKEDEEKEKMGFHVKSDSLRFFFFEKVVNRVKNHFVMITTDLCTA